MFGILNFDHWDLFEICFLVLGVFSALTPPLHLVTSIQYTLPSTQYPVPSNPQPAPRNPYPALDKPLHQTPHQQVPSICQHKQHEFKRQGHHYRRQHHHPHRKQNTGHHHVND